MCDACDAIRAFLSLQSDPVGFLVKHKSEVNDTTNKIGKAVDKIATTVQKTVRKPSRYNKTWAKHYKKLRGQHPKTTASTLMKRAHKLTKKELK